MFAPDIGHAQGSIAGHRVTCSIGVLHSGTQAHPHPRPPLPGFCKPSPGGSHPDHGFKPRATRAERKRASRNTTYRPEPPTSKLHNLPCAAAPKGLSKTHRGPRHPSALHPSVVLQSPKTHCPSLATCRPARPCPPTPPAACVNAALLSPHTPG